MIESATGIVLRTRPLTETSLIVHWLTPDFGRIATVAKGARRAKSPLLGKLDLFYVADFSFSRNRRSVLHILREVSLRDPHAALRQNLICLRQATYAALLVEQTTETETPLPAVYDLMLHFLNHLCQQPPKPQAVFAFELKLLHELGLKPDWRKTNLSPGGKKIGQVLTLNDWPTVTRVKLSHAQTTELRQFLHGFLIFHLGQLPKGRAVATATQDGK